MRYSRIDCEVTADIIARAKPKDSRICMASEALRAAVPEATKVESDLATMRFSAGGWRYIYLTPRDMQQALVDFDQGRALRPFRFRLALIQRTRSTSTRDGKRVQPSRRKRIDRNGVINGGRPVFSPTLTRNVTLKKGGRFHRVYGAKQLEP